MVIGGFQRFSLSDFPGTISAIVFTRGCSFRCPYCHNPELVDPDTVRRRVPIDRGPADFLDPGGAGSRALSSPAASRPCTPICPELSPRVKHMGFAVKLDTNGTQSPHASAARRGRGSWTISPWTSRRPLLPTNAGACGGRHSTTILRSIELDHCLRHRPRVSHDLRGVAPFGQTTVGRSRSL